MYPLLRVALLLMLGVVIGDAVDDVVSSRMWYWAYALAVVAAIVVWKVCRGFVVQTSMIYIAIVLLGAWRVGVYNESMTMEYTDATILLRQSWCRVRQCVPPPCAMSLLFLMVDLQASVCRLTSIKT